ncbi:nucleoside 2-deoxyribosyltransferase [Niveispirillum lacus]|uniref:nucleoside 2-deoxyribosyltransferase n=1 Tax=Niveispirillum lacus TaxID=1981099 RepID=UPI0010549385|nr:nucleoside 2-deoxyribosyltransferase [Niveispirillum lacus]
MIVYVSGALKASRDLSRARALYEEAARIVVDAGHQAYLPHQTTDPLHNADASPAQVFQQDVLALMQADGVVAFLNEPSLGVGAELALCTQAGTRVLGLHNTDSDVSRFAVGLLEAHGGRLVQYDELENIEEAILRFLEDLTRDHSFKRGRSL